MKYLWRWRNKAGVEDLKKAQIYLTWLIESAEKDLSGEVFANNNSINGKKLNPEHVEVPHPKLEYIKVDPSSLDDWLRDLYFNSIIEDLRVCSLKNGCSGCRRALAENGCDLLESDAADAIEFLLKELKEKKDTKTPTEK